MPTVATMSEDRAATGNTEGHDQREN